MRDHMRKAIRSVPVVATGILVVAVAACSSGSTTTKAPAGAAEVAKALDKALKEHVAGQTDEAVRDYKAVLAFDPKNKFAHYNLGLIYQTRGKNTAAEAEYRATLSIDAAYVPARLNLGELLLEAGRQQEGQAEIAAAVKLDPSLNRRFAGPGGVTPTT